MHPYLIERLARDHRHDLLRAAGTSRAARRHQQQRSRPPVRNRAGWVLIEIGLRLAGPAGGT